MRVATEIVLTEDERVELTELPASRLSSARLSQCARIVLLAADGMQNQQIAEQLGIGRIQVARWRGRHAQQRLSGIERDLPRGAPLKKWRGATMTHDYKRNGTTTLFAALNVFDGQVIGQRQQRHAHVEWAKFLK